ncbi:LCP family protein [uncultured Chloroflexus sp.]|uniref:LCP family protein n=1 Tax=uncultured Chloroflexus sp. TaxID=214040 RepID=UPI0026059DDE|nr:LCP family protein [uncultured Chloroflexus sp.]
MNCSEARALLAAGIRPGSGSTTQALLHDHLAQCATCRALAEGSDQALLAALLATPLPERPPTRNWSIHHLLFLLLALLAGWLGFQTGRVVLAGITISQNMTAMQLPSPAITVTPAMMAIATPLPTPIPSPLLSLDQPTTTSEAIAVDASPTPAALEIAVAASITPIRLPAIDGRVPVPTLMPTVGVRLPEDDAIHILLLGSDRRPGESWATRSDAVMLVRIEPSQRRVALLSLPRDLMVDIPGYGYGRINSATVYGEMNPAIGGAELARRTVTNLLGLPIDHIVWVDFTGFTAAVDAIGGIEVELEQAIYDPAYPTMDYGITTVYFPAGKQWIDGAQALILSRTRHADSAYAREERQQMIALAIARRIREHDPVRQVELAAHVTTALRPHIRTDLSADELLGLAWSLREVDLGAIERFALGPDDVYEGLIEGDPYALTPRPGAIAALVRDFVNGK